jgi:glycine/D-amino acid oxidase-like deaminating enzyme
MIERRVDVVGGGICGLAVAWNLLSCARERDELLLVRVFDAGGGASGAAAGLLNPFRADRRTRHRGTTSAATDLLLWRGLEGCAATLELLRVSEEALGRRVASRSGILSLPKALEPGGGRLLLTEEQASHLLPGLTRPALWWSEGVSVDTPAYVAGLRAACERLSSGAQRFELVSRRLSSLASLSSDSECGPSLAVIAAAGAGALSLPELAGLPLRLCGGASLRLRRPSHASADPSPALVAPCGSYVAPGANGDEYVVGGTKEWDVPFERSFVAGPLPVDSPAALSAAAELLPPMQAVLPSLAACSLASAAWGVRAHAPVTPAGSLPLAFELPTERSAARVFVLAGMGARGLVYHALLARLVVRAALGCAEEALPVECGLPATKKPKAETVRRRDASPGVPPRSREPAVMSC